MTTRVETPVVARTRGELARALLAVRDETAPQQRTRRTVALVPTMGALHAGHRALLGRARELADAVVVSVFVNPLQFGPGEDLEHYPRTFEADLAVCRAEGAALVFAPRDDVVYPTQPLVRVDAGPLGRVLEGASRPGHFDGVLTVVAKLFNLVRPDVAVFGEKDAQQLLLVRRMVADLDLPVHVASVPTVREPDGLALSSRNRYLTARQRSSALALSRALAAAAAAAAAGANADGVRRRARDVLAAEPAVEVDYLALVEPTLLADVPAGFAGSALLAVAARVGATRLIDNTTVTIGGG